MENESIIWYLLPLIVGFALTIGAGYFGRNYTARGRWGLQRKNKKDEAVEETGDETSGNVNVNSTTGGQTAPLEDGVAATDGSRHDTYCDKEEYSDEVIEERSRQLIIDCLQELGCKPEGNGRGGLLFRYQGEAFSAAIHKDLIRIWDLPFSEVDKRDPRIPIILEAMNEANMNVGPTVVLSEPNDDGMRQFIARMDVILFYSIDDPSQYLDTVLGMFIEIRHWLRVELDKRLSKSGDSVRENSIDPSMN